jgi:citrate lyase subunit beta/citryl-CoA lyase
LEDGITAEGKQQAREVIVNALRDLDWTDKVTLVRVNPMTSGFTEDDVDVVAPGRPTAILQGKCEGPEDIRYLDRLLDRAERKHGIEHGTIKIAAMIERIRALQTIDEIATASTRMIALYIGPSDLGNEFGYRRTYQGQELEILWVRTRVIFAAHAAGLLAIDSPTLFYKDMELTKQQAEWSYRVGFDAKTCISPRQISAVNEAFRPSSEEIAWAREVMEGAETARVQERAVWTTQGMMIDAPFVLRARRILESVSAER